MFLGVQPLSHLQTLLQVSALHVLLSVNAYKPVRQSGGGSCRTCTSVVVWSGYMQLGATKRAEEAKADHLQKESIWICLADRWRDDCGWFSCRHRYSVHWGA